MSLAPYTPDWLNSLEEAISTWTVTKPTDIRSEALLEHGLKGPDISVGQEVHNALQRVPVGVMAVDREENGKGGSSQDERQVSEWGEYLRWKVGTILKIALETERKGRQL